MLKLSDTARETDSHSGLTGGKGHLQPEQSWYFRAEIQCCFLTSLVSSADLA